MSRAFCSEGNHYPSEIIAQGLYNEIGVIQDGTGLPTDRYADGTTGVTTPDRVESMIDDSPVCGEHQDCYVTWDHREEGK